MIERFLAWVQSLFSCKHEHLIPRFVLEGEYGVFYDECADCGAELYD